MSSSIERLPVEIFDIIATYFDLPDYQLLRLSSQRLCLLTFSTFAKKHFCDLTTTLGSASLDRLVDISSHRYFCSVVTVLDVRLLNHGDYTLLTKISRVGIFPPTKRFLKVSGVRPEHVSEEATLYDDIIRSENLSCISERLTRALRGFTNLRAIRFRAHHAEPLGYRMTTMDEGDQVFRTRCFQAVMGAITRSNISLEEFSMAKGRRTTTLSKCANLPYPALQLPYQSLQKVQFCFANLASLALSAISAYNGDSRVPGWENAISNLIAAAPSIKHLALSLDRSSRISHYSAAIVRSLALSCRLSDLKTFQLVNCSAHEKDLEIFITAHAEALQELILSEIRLLTGSWSSLWLSLKRLPALECMRLASLEGTRSPVLFRRRDKERVKVTLDSKKAERRMSDMLDDLVIACNAERDQPLPGIDIT